MWRPNGGPGGAAGFEKTERHIESLDGVSCWTMNRFFGTVDWNADGQTELVTVGKDGHFWTHQLNVPTLHWESQSLSAMVPNVLGLDIADDPVANMITFPLTHVHAEQMDGEWHALRVLFPDLNGDGYPDVLFAGPRGTTVKPFVAINEGRDEYLDFMWPYDPIDGDVNTFDYSPFARVFDYSGDHRDDLVIPVVGACTTTDAYACYVVFESGRVGEQAKVSFTDVPFEHPDEYDVAPQYLIRTADVNGDALTDIVHPMVSDQMFVFANQSEHNVLTSVTTGHNPLDPGDPGFLPDVTFEYGNLVDGAAHAFPWQLDSLTYIAHADAANTCVYPRTCVMGGLPVVSAYTLNNGQNKARRFSMHYRDGRAHRHGRGFLGFAEVETRDVDTGIATRRRFDNVTFDPTFKTFPFAGIPSETRSTTPLPTTTLETRTSAKYEVVSTNAGKTYFVATRSTEKLRKEGADVLERSWTIVDDVDDYGNVLQWRSGSDGVDVLNASTRIVKNDPATWLIGLVEQDSTCSTALGETRCRTTTMKHNALGEVFRIDRAPNDTTAHLVTYLIRDQYGNVINAIAEDDFGNHREECVTYEPTGTFPWAVRNAAGHTSYMHYHHGLGVPFSMRDANGLVTKWRLDGFGRTVEEHAPDGLVTTFSAERVKKGVWTTHTKRSTPGHGARETVFDSFERPMQMRVRGPDVDTVGISAFGKSVWIVQDKRYDFLGRLEWQSIPRIDGDAIAELKGSTFEYDNAGRLTKTMTPWGAPITRTYDHDKVTTIEPGPAGIPTIAKSMKADPLGRPIEVTDAKQGITRHVHGPFNELRRVELPDGTKRETKQDDYGRTIFEDDPDRGKTILEHNGFDEVVKLHDAAGRHYAFERDALGRVVKRSEGLNVSAYEYDTALHGVGLFARTTGADGHIEEYAYDTLSRPIATMLRLADGRTFEQSRTYDAYGRIAQIAYPNGFSVLRQYDSTGTLVRIHNGADRTQVVWSLDVVNAAGQTMFETFGNGAATERVYSDEAQVLETIFTMADGKTLQSLRYEYDAQLNVKNRLDARQGKIERFGHDALNRVTGSRVDTCPNAGMCFDADLPCDVDVHYGPTGNVTYKSDVGMYAADPLHPHAVKSAGSLQFGYDAVGNQIERPNETITYTDFDLPRQYIPKAGGAPTTFEYNASGERVRRIRGELETVYLGDVYERETNGNVVTDRFYVHNDERVIAVVERLQSGHAWRYVHVEHLGSVDVITDAGGQEIDRRSFDVWGAPRDPKWGGSGSPSQNVSTRRGFTWHEWDDDVGLVNAKGRIYDPHIARFLQTDPIIADLLDAQTQNPYSYTFNRPLVFTDPSGYDAEAHSVLLQGAGTPGYVTPEQAQLVQDHQKTWLMQWSRERPATAPPQQWVVEYGPAGADPAPSSPEKLVMSHFSPAEQVMVGVGERAIELGPELAVGLFFNFVGAGASGGATAKPGSGSFDGAGVRVIDDLNQANPLYGASIGVIQLGEAHEKGDYVGIGRAGLDVVTVVVMTAITLKASRGVVDQAKFRYLFGEAGGNTHNVARTAQNAGQMARIGVYNTAEGQALLKSHFESAVKDSSNIVRTFKNQYGAFQVRESLFAGPGGFVKFESTWQVLEGGGLRFTTAIPFGGP
ncbi:MAG: RHS repeat-associated core domain-containing protein [Polyangiaceae bacterium]|nr:RHS repeat-associated core domain-containing protein [Polyangiaceae bacterium]